MGAKTVTSTTTDNRK